MVLLTYGTLLGSTSLQMSDNTNNVAYFQQYTFSINKENVHNKYEGQRICQNAFPLTNSLKRSRIYWVGIIFKWLYTFVSTCYQLIAFKCYIVEKPALTCSNQFYYLVDIKSIKCYYRPELLNFVFKSLFDFYYFISKRNLGKYYLA